MVNGRRVKIASREFVDFSPTRGTRTELQAVSTMGPSDGYTSQQCTRVDGHKTGGHVVARVEIIFVFYVRRHDAVIGGR